MIRSLVEYIDLVLTRWSDYDELWFRGILQNSLAIQPGLYWRNIVDEPSLVTGFTSQAPQILESPHQLLYSDKLSAPWQWYFMMQHYGLPTRLVDWSESPLIALYFAVKSAAVSQAAGTSINPCVWCLEPNRFNQMSVDYAGIVTPGGEFARHWIYQTDPTSEDGCIPGRSKSFTHNHRTYSNELPLAIYPIRSNRRILAQQGVFTVHGSDSRGIDRMTNYSRKNNSSKEDMLFRIDIKKSACMKILQELECMKVQELALFPELPQLSMSLLARATFEPTVSNSRSKNSSTKKSISRRRSVKKRASRR